MQVIAAEPPSCVLLSSAVATFGILSLNPRKGDFKHAEHAAAAVSPESTKRYSSCVICAWMPARRAVARSSLVINSARSSFNFSRSLFYLRSFSCHSSIELNAKLSAQIYNLSLFRFFHNRSKRALGSGAGLGEGSGSGAHAPAPAAAPAQVFTIALNPTSGTHRRALRRRRPPRSHRLMARRSPSRWPARGRRSM
jgi:hypothetical protein